MCGIYVSSGRSQFRLPSSALQAKLKCRGPDDYNCIHYSPELTVEAYCPRYLTAASSVLSLREGSIVRQPRVGDPSDDSSEGRSFLSWNGEMWKYAGKAVHAQDTDFIFKRLNSCWEAIHCKDAAYTRKDYFIQEVANVLSKISGPYAFVFYDTNHKLLFFGRDVLGRRSLLFRKSSDGCFEIASVSGDSGDDSFDEVKADGIYVLDLALASSTAPSGSPAVHGGVPEVLHVPWRTAGFVHGSKHSILSPFPPFNNSPDVHPPNLGLISPAVYDLIDYLKSSLKTRINFAPIAASSEPPQSRPAILFSGGLDCTLIARVAHDILPSDQVVDLLNVAFENPRLTQAASKASKEGDNVPSAYELCPDRVTGRSSYAELVKLCPTRLWHFVAIDVPYAELGTHRSEVVSLLRPHNTVMDFSIGCSLYFAARGSGVIFETGSKTAEQYTTPARVLLSGLGADELFGGYTRHATAFQRHGHPGLAKELELDFKRIAERNLGRDDRIISHWGKEVRYPFLDEDLVTWALKTPVSQKCGFGDHSENIETPDPCKRLLRLAAWNLGLREAANQKKRAIQFGARTAKMESGSTKGTQALTTAVSGCT